MDRPILNTSRPSFSLFLYTSVCALITIFACWALAWHYNLPSDMWCPPISLTGFLYPERAVYIAGFTLTFFLGVASLKQLRLLFAAEAPESALLKFAVRVLFIALLGMLGQALVPFQKNTFTARFPQDLETTTIVHLVFAAVFFYGAQIHAIAVLIARLQYKNRLNLPVKFKAASLAGNIFCLYFMNSVLPDSVNSEGISQRLGVFCILGFFADYTRDFNKISRSFA